MKSSTLSRPAAAESDASNTSDTDILAAVRNGDTLRFAVLVRRHNERLYRIGIGCLRRADLVEDAMQSTWIHAFHRLPAFDGRAAFSTWLSRIMINECLMHLRRTRREERTRLAVESDPLLAHLDTTDAGRQADAGEAHSLMEHCIAGLPDEYRLVYVLREIQELGTDETAGIVGISPANVRVRLCRARERLKQALLASAAGRELFRFTAVRCGPFTARVMRQIQTLSVVPAPAGRQQTA